MTTLGLMETPVLPHLAYASDEEMEALGSNTEKERNWYSGRERYFSAGYIKIAAAAGRLSFVGADSNITPIMRLRNPQLENRYPSYLLPNAHAGLRAVGRLWRSELENIGISDDRLRLAATSLVRTVPYQHMLVSTPGVLASRESTHCYGGAFDLDAAGYYVVENGEVRKVSHPERTQAAAKMIGEAIVADEATPTLIATGEFNTQVNQALIGVADKLHEAGMVNRILEFAGTKNQCVHTAVNPEVTTEEWNGIAV